MSREEVIYYGARIDTNATKLQRVHDVMTLALGVGSGILMLESLRGFLFYIIGFSLTNLTFYFVCCHGDGKKYFFSPVKQIFIDSIWSNVAGYVMMWCLVYALVK